jgi:hypothetical protein
MTMELPPEVPIGCWNIRSVCGWSAGPLTVVCQCGHRELLPLRLLRVHDDDMSPVYSRPIVCTACAGRDFRGIVPVDPDR